MGDNRAFTLYEASILGESAMTQSATDKLIADGSWHGDASPKLANALKIAVSAPDDAMCDAARGFILGLDMSVRTFEGMRKHLEALGEPIPYWMPDTGHITKWDVAQCIYNLMQDVRIAEIEREAKKGE